MWIPKRRSGKPSWMAPVSGAFAGTKINLFRRNALSKSRLAAVPCRIAGMTDKLFRRITASICWIAAVSAAIRAKRAKTPANQQGSVFWLRQRDCVLQTKRNCAHCVRFVTAFHFFADSSASPRLRVRFFFGGRGLPRAGLIRVRERFKA